MTQAAAVTAAIATPSAGGENVRLARIGKRPVVLPKGVTVTQKDGKFEVKGPKGTLSYPGFQNVDIKIEASGISVTPTLPGRDGARFQGLARALLQSMVTGVAEGYTKTLQLVGTGYRAEVKGTMVNLALGLSHPINFPLPTGVKAEVPGDSKGTVLILTGPDKAIMGQTAAKIRGFRPPSPYGGKGVRYMGEKIREKAGKAGKGGKGGK
jgi:large subunit ribosomal protein L6